MRATTALALVNSDPKCDDCHNDGDCCEEEPIPAEVDRYCNINIELFKRIIDPITSSDPLTYSNNKQSYVKMKKDGTQSKITMKIEDHIMAKGFAGIFDHIK